MFRQYPRAGERAETFEDHLNSVAVIGGGITGLTAAFYLKRKGIPVTLYEASARAGGVIQSLRDNGYLAEFGPNTILETSPKIPQLVKDLGLESRRLYPLPRAETRYLVRTGQPIKMPGSPLGFFTSRLFSARAKLDLLREPFVPRRQDNKEESVAEFVERRLGKEFLDRAIDPLVAGIYAGDPHKLSVVHAFPRLAHTETRYGSLIKGQIFGGRERKQRGEVSKDRAPKFSFDEGLQVLTDALAQSLGNSLQLGGAVTEMSQTQQGWLLTVSRRQDQSTAEHSAIIYAGTAFNLAKLRVTASPPIDLKPFSEIRHPPVASVVLGFGRQDVQHPCEGFGMLIPKIEGFKILGTIFSSSLFPNRAPAGHLTLTSYVGGERYPDLASLSTDDLVALTLADLRSLLGVTGEPTFRHVAFYPKAIPQYNVGYGRYRELMTEIERRDRGLFLAGHFRDGVSLADSIVSGCNAADRAQLFSVSAKPVAMEASKVA